MSSTFFESDKDFIFFLSFNLIRCRKHSRSNLFTIFLRISLSYDFPYNNRFSTFYPFFCVLKLTALSMTGKNKKRPVIF
jgi:hypothetical protein